MRRLAGDGPIGRVDRHGHRIEVLQNPIDVALAFVAHDLAHLGKADQGFLLPLLARRPGQLRSGFEDHGAVFQEAAPELVTGVGDARAQFNILAGVALVGGRHLVGVLDVDADAHQRGQRRQGILDGDLAPEFGLGEFPDVLDRRRVRVGFAVVKEHHPFDPGDQQRFLERLRD